MRDAVQLKVLCPGGAVVQKEHGAVAVREEVFEREHLPAVAQGVARQQPNLGQGIEHYAAWLYALNLPENVLRRVLELDLGRVKGGILIFRTKAVLCRR